MGPAPWQPAYRSLSLWLKQRFPKEEALAPSVSPHILRAFKLNVGTGNFSPFGDGCCSPSPVPWGWHSPRAASSKNEVVKRIKNNELDSLLSREKKYKMALKLKDVLAKEKAHVMSLNDLGKLRKKMGVSRTKRFASFAASYPRVFNIIKDEKSMLWMEFTDEVEDLLEEEEHFRKHVHEPWLVEKLRKLLMMSSSRRIAVDKVAHLKHEFGLPEDFRTELVHKYPQYFRVLKGAGSGGPILELTEWDSALAITARERSIKEESSEFDDLIGENTGYGFRINNPKGYTLRKKQRELMATFQTLPFPSPYSDSSGFGQNTLELEKRTVALIHELLSMTLQKRAPFSHISHFRQEFRLPQRLLALLLRHQGIFYVSLKGDVYTVFLKEAFEGSTLKERNALLDFNSRLAELCMKGKTNEVTHADSRLGENEGESERHLLPQKDEKSEDAAFDDEEEIVDDDDHDDAYNSHDNDVGDDKDDDGIDDEDEDEDEDEDDDDDDDDDDDEEDEDEDLC